MLSSPYIFSNRSTSWVMYGVLCAMIPGLIAYTYWVGGYFFIVQSLLLIALCVGFECICLYVRKRSIKSCYDGSAVLTAVFLSLSIPPWTSLYILVVGAFFAIVGVKHLYGGLGHNFLNPAMMAYAILVIAFPDQISNWPQEKTLGQWDVWLNGVQWAVDAVSQATPLIEARFHSIENSWSKIVPYFLSDAWLFINVGFAVGAVVLLLFRLMDWRIPVAIFFGFICIAVIDFFIYPSDVPLNMVLVYHFFSGQFILGAFFIATDPVSASTTVKGRWLYGIVIGVIIYSIRTYGQYADSIAFAVLFGNMLAPLIDFYTKPKIYGH